AGSVLSGTGTLSGGALVPAWGGASDLWHEYLAGYHDVGIGSAASAPPYVAVVAALATVLGGKPWLAVDVLLFGCVPAAGAAAAWRWLGLRTVINAAIVAALPAVLLVPWTFRLVTSPAAVFGEAGLLRPGLSSAYLRPASLLLLSPGGPGLPPVWVTAG